MKSANPYLTFNGNCEEAFNFYKSVFGGEFSALMRFKDAPAEELEKIGCAADGEKAEKIIFVSLPLGKNTVLMGGDSPGEPVAAGANFSIAVGAESKAEADKLFNALAAGGKILSPIAEDVWGAYFGMLSDKFGVGWMIDCESGERA